MKRYRYNCVYLHRILKDLQYDDIIIEGKSFKAAWNNRGLKLFVENAIDRFKNFTLYFDPLATKLNQIFSEKNSMKYKKHLPIVKYDNYIKEWDYEKNKDRNPNTLL